MVGTNNFLNIFERVNIFLIHYWLRISKWSYEWLLTTYSFFFIWFISNFFTSMYISTLSDFQFFLQIFDDIFQTCTCGHVKWCFYLKWISIFIVQDEPEPAKYQRIRRLSIYPGKGNFNSLSKIQSNLVIRNVLIRNKLALRNFLWITNPFIP